MISHAISLYFLIKKSKLTIGDNVYKISRAALFIAFLTFQSVAFAGAVRTGAGFNQFNLPANDDDSTDLISLPFTINFFGQEFDALFLNNNGNVTFDSRLPTFTPFDLTATGRQIIAPYFADVDTRGGGTLTYSPSVTLNGRNAFVATWNQVGYFANNVDRLNTFQLILVDRSDIRIGDFDIEMNYDQIRWETGDVSGGNNGLGGNSARVGFSNGTGVDGTFFELEGSAINGAFLNGRRNSLVSGRFRSDVNGRYLFSARNGVLFGGTAEQDGNLTFLVPIIKLLLDSDNQ